jgi:hypothetical protein
VPTTSNSATATFAGDTAVNLNMKSAISCQRSRYLGKKWRIKLNESKSVHIDFTNNKIKQHPIFINGTKVPYANTAKYLGMTLDAKLQWKEHVKNETR